MNQDEYLRLSGIQHYAFCRRQWALIHIEQRWEENVRTVEGHFLHKNAHSNVTEKRGDIMFARGMPVISHKLQVQGVCDVVEFHRHEEGITLFGHEGSYHPYPVEYKRGRPKEDDSDALQLCAQAICLEEMLACIIAHGFLYYGESRRRQQILFDQELRGKVQIAFEEMRQLYERRHTPKARVSKRCKACSLVEICLPRLEKAPKASYYIRSTLKEGGIE